jgi:hypothetical protein
MNQSITLTPVKKPATIRELGAVDLTKLKMMVARIPDKVWEIADEQKENKFFCFYHTRHLVFRFIRGNYDPYNFYSTSVWPLWEPILRPIFEQVIVPYHVLQPEYPKAMLARLAAGHSIDSHVDGERSNPLVHKIHVPIQTNSKALLTVAGEAFHLREGIAYEVNNLVPHSVINGGDSDRLHLIFEVFETAQ